MVEWLGRRPRPARLGRRARFAVLVTALAACAAGALLVGSAAFGQAEDKVCTSVGCAQLGYEGQITTLWVQNTALPGGSNITGESLSISGTQVIGVSGTTLCQASSNVLDCNATITPGSIFTASPVVQTSPPVGTSATVTLVVAGATYTIDLQVQATSLAGNGSSPPPPPPPSCEPTLHVAKTLHVRHVLRDAQDFLKHRPGPDGGTYLTWPAPRSEASFYYQIEVTNTSNCEARGVSISDDLPLNFRCTYLRINVGDRERNRECPSRKVLVQVGTLGPGESARIIVDGKWTTVGEGKVFFNTAYAEAKSPPLEAKSEPPLAVKVLTERQFEKAE
jgi:hypothetical protein